jgi:hypothetical protein
MVIRTLPEILQRVKHSTMPRFLALQHRATLFCELVDAAPGCPRSDPIGRGKDRQPFRDGSPTPTLRTVAPNFAPLTIVSQDACVRRCDNKF